MNTPAIMPAPFMTADDFAARFTTDEFLSMCAADAFADMRVELVKGELQRIGPPMSVHALRQSQIIAALWSIVSEAGFLVLGETGIDLGGDSVMACDAAVIRHPIAERRLIRPAELLLVIEIADTMIARDTTLKRLAYAAAGIAHYWVVDGDRAVVHVHARPADGDYTAVHTVRFGAPLPVPQTGASIVIQ